MHYRHNMGTTYLRESVYASLQQCMEIAMKALISGEDGRLLLGKVCFV
jgi:hypothetical protein